LLHFFPLSLSPIRPPPVSFFRRAQFQHEVVSRPRPPHLFFSFTVGFPTARRHAPFLPEGRRASVRSTRASSSPTGLPPRLFFFFTEISFFQLQHLAYDRAVSVVLVGFSRSLSFFFFPLGVPLFIQTLNRVLPLPLCEMRRGNPLRAQRAFLPFPNQNFPFCKDFLNLSPPFFSFLIWLPPLPFLTGVML